MKKLLKDTWFYITHPSYWVMNYSYNKKYDKWFNKLLESSEFEKPSSNGYLDPDCWVYLGDETFWIENQPYACFTSEMSSFNKANNTKRRFRPSRRTIYKAIKKLKKEC